MDRRLGCLIGRCRRFAAAVYPFASPPDIKCVANSHCIGVLLRHATAGTRRSHFAPPPPDDDDDGDDDNHRLSISALRDRQRSGVWCSGSVANRWLVILQLCGVWSQIRTGSGQCQSR
jgi:hypothetical protein